MVSLLEGEGFVLLGLQKWNTRNRWDLCLFGTNSRPNEHYILCIPLILPIIVESMELLNTDLTIKGTLPWPSCQLFHCRHWAVNVAESVQQDTIEGMNEYSLRFSNLFLQLNYKIFCPKYSFNSLGYFF